jgi:hypothetical protein
MCIIRSLKDILPEDGTLVLPDIPEFMIKLPSDSETKLPPL